MIVNMYEDPFLENNQDVTNSTNEETSSCPNSEVIIAGDTVTLSLDEYYRLTRRIMTCYRILESQQRTISNLM